MMGAAVPLSWCGSATLPEQHCPLDLFSYQNHFSGVVLIPICTVSYMVHYFCIDGPRRPWEEEDGGEGHASWCLW
jgi:hypothetical protein